MKPMTVVFTVCLLALAGCASHKPETMSLAKFEGLEPAEQEEVITELESVPERRERFMTAQLLAGNPYTYQFGNVNYQIYCIPYPGSQYRELVVHHGQKAPNFGQYGNSAMGTIAADDQCKPLLRDTGGGVKAPISLRNDTAMVSPFWREFALRTGPAVVNGIGAAKITSNGRCNGGCGPTFNTTAVAQQSAQAESGANVDVNSGGKSGPPEN